MQIYDELIARGLLAQVTDEDEIRDLVNNGKATFYIGFDCTADSLTAGHFMALTLMKRMQMAGNKPIALIGGGTTMIGDPSGRTDMRKMLTREEIDHNAECFKRQMERFIEFGEGKAMMLNNADWLLNLNMKEEHLRLRDHSPEELCFYSKGTTDFEFLFPFGWGELWGVADRTDYDLKQHQEHSGKDLTYFDQEKNEHYIPYVIEPSLGADRVTLAFLVDAYDEEIVGQDKKGNNDVRTVLRLHPALAPFKCAVLPLSKKEVLSGPAQQLRDELARDFMVDYDDTGSIGKRYRRQDEIGTPFCITLDFQTVGDDTTPADHCVTIRERDSMEQVRIPMSEVKNYIAERIKF